MPNESDTSGLQTKEIPPLLPVGMPDTPPIADFPEVESQFVDEDEFRTFAEADDLHRELRIPAELALDFHEDLMEAKREFEDPTGAPEAKLVDVGDDPDFNSTPGLPPAPPIDPIQHILVRKKSEDLLALPTEQPGRPLPNPENEISAYKFFRIAEGGKVQSDWTVGDPPPPLSSFLESNHFQSLSTEQRNLAFDRWSRYFNHWVTHHPGYTDSLRADHTATMRQVHDWIDSEKTIGEYVAGLGSSLLSTVKGIAGGLALQLGETATNFLDTNSSFDNIIGAKTTQVFDRWGRDITHRYDETLDRDELLNYEEQGFTIQTIRSDAHPEYDPLTGDTTYRVDRREKLDEALSAFQHDLDTGNHPGGLAYTTWLGQWNKKIVDLATDYNREDRISLDRSLSDLESSRFFRKNETLATLLLDYRYTRRQATFDEIVRILTETDIRKQTEEDIAVELEDPNGVVGFVKDHLSPEDFQIVLDAGTDPVEIASNAASLAYGLGTAAKVAKATKRTIKQTTKAVGKNAAGEALVEGTTEGFTAFVDDSRADIGSAARDGAIMGILLQGVSATGGAAYSGARKGIKDIHEFHAELKQFNEQLDSIGGNYDGMSEADFGGEAESQSPLDEGETTGSTSPETTPDSPAEPSGPPFSELQSQRQEIVDKSPDGTLTEEQANEYHNSASTSMRNRFDVMGVQVESVPGDGGMTVSATPDGQIVARSPQERGARARQEQNGDARRTLDTIDRFTHEESGHLAMAVAIREDWIADGKPGDFDIYLQEHLGKEIRDLRDHSGNLSEADAAAIADGFRSSVELYYGKDGPEGGALRGETLTEMLDDLSSRPITAQASVLGEFVRQAVQDRSTGRLSEVRSRQPGFFQQATQKLRDLLGNLRRSRKAFENIGSDAPVQRLIERTEAVLAEAEAQGLANTNDAPLEVNKNPSDGTREMVFGEDENLPESAYEQERPFVSVGREREAFLSKNDSEEITSSEIDSLHQAHMEALENRLQMDRPDSAKVEENTAPSEETGEAAHTPERIDPETRVYVDESVAKPTAVIGNDAIVRIAMPPHYKGSREGKSRSEIAAEMEADARKAEFDAAFLTAHIDEKSRDRAREKSNGSPSKGMRKQIDELTGQAKAARAQADLADHNVEAAKAELEKAENSGAPIDVLTERQVALNDAIDVATAENTRAERMEGNVEKLILGARGMSAKERQRLGETNPLKTYKTALKSLANKINLDAPETTADREAFVRGLRDASQEAGIPPITTKNTADILTEIDGMHPGDQVKLVSRLAYEIHLLYRTGRDSQGRPAGTSPGDSPYHGAAVAAARETLPGDGMKFFTSLSAEVSRREDIERFRAVRDQFKNDPLYNPSDKKQIDDPALAAKIHRKLGLGQTPHPDYKSVSTQPVTIARHPDGGEPVITMPLNRMEESEWKGVSSTILEKTRNERESMVDPEFAKDWFDAVSIAAEHSEALALWQFRQANPDAKTAVVTTAGRWVCGRCIGNRNRVSGLAEIAAALGFTELTIHSEPVGTKAAFQERGLRHTNSITVQIDNSSISHNITGFVRSTSNNEN